VIQSVKSRLNAQRTQGFEDFDGDRLIHTRACEGNATTNHLATAISSTPISRQRPMVLAAGVTNLECTATTTAAQQSGQWCGTVSDRAIRTPHARVPTGVGADLLLVAHELFPCNIPLVVVGDRNFPLFQRASVTACLTRAAIHDGGASMVPSPDEDTGIGRVFQETEDAGVDRFDPDHSAVTGLARECRDQQFLVAIPK